MRRTALGTASLVAAIVALAACSSEPTFEDRYDSAQEQIADKAQALEEELSGDRTTAPERASAGAGENGRSAK